jgi:hypothetical protein
MRIPFFDKIDESRNVLKDSETCLLCRDMRTRNFGTSFGDLEVWLDTNKKILRTRFHV